MEEKDDLKLIEEDFEYYYQKDLTEKLDRLSDSYNQNILNEIVLWKVNRYVNFPDDVILLINRIENDLVLDIEKTSEVLRELIKIKGVRLPMASTILRFRNPKIYQIIDQRVFRIIYSGRELKLKSYLSKEAIEAEIELYLKYLNDLREKCSVLNIAFEDADRVLYMADKRLNGKINY